MKTLNTLKLAVPYALIAMGIIIAPNAQAANIISGSQYVVKTFNSSSGDYDKIGTIKEFVATDITLEQFYDYRDGKYNGVPLPFQTDHAHLFMVRDKNNKLGLFSVNGSPNNTHASLIQMDYRISGGIFDTIPVIDDQYLSQSSEVWRDPSDPDHVLQSYYGWNVNKNDGMVATVNDAAINDNNGTLPWEITVNILDRSTDCYIPGNSNPNCPISGFQSIDFMNFLSGDNNNINGVPVTNGTSFVITKDDKVGPSTIPEPSNLVGLSMLGILGGGLMIWQKRKST